MLNQGPENIYKITERLIVKKGSEILLKER